VRELRSAQSELLERADQTRVVNDLARALRQDLDSAQLVNRAAESVGQATVVDRCDVMLVDAERYSAIRGTWSASPSTARLPRPESFVDLPEPLIALLLEAAQEMGAVQVDDVLDDPRLDAAGAGEILDSLGVRALAAVPVAVGDEVVGWLLLQSVEPRGWQSREFAIGQGISHDLVVSLMQVQAFEQQRESVRRLEELDRAKDAFISTVSHELRTPLTSIVGYLELINDGGMGPIDGGLSATMGIIERNVGRLRSLVEDLLTLSAYDSQQVRLDLTRVDLSDIVADVRQALMPHVVARGLEIAVDAEPGLPLVMVDRTQFDRVVLNLLDNAVKFSHDGGRIDVVLRSEGEDVVLDVTDHGIGVPAEEQSRLFSRFFRSSLSVAGEIQGTGLGLALARSVVEWHDGTVALASADGRTTVTVRLPCSR
jgi:two-component system phosphate regulon sensor histidine kinase PhoR